MEVYLNVFRGTERVWPPRNEAQPNGEGLASGSATEIFIANYFSCGENRSWQMKIFFQSEMLQRC